ncbi:hypothetical protein NPIL_213781 [Nephila pilipes]|uniref:Uncharacterized protein n=1 Tax=Nephila pilipes TaxID=299642 RepID=A0A8X6P877_NEPPI|nr:hypothetical protein NPIL_213781 [Nephila pilipes]
MQATYRSSLFEARVSGMQFFQMKLPFTFSRSGLDDNRTTSGCQASRRRILLHLRSVRKRPRLYLRIGLPFTYPRIKITV